MLVWLLIAVHPSMPGNRHATQGDLGRWGAENDPWKPKCYTVSTPPVAGEPGLTLTMNPGRQLKCQHVAPS